MLKWIRTAAVAALVIAAPAFAQVYKLTPDSWSALSNGTDYTAAQLGVNIVSGSSLDGSASNKATFRTWAGASMTEPTGGQYNSWGASPGFIALANNQQVRFIATSDGSAFGGSSGSYTGYATVSCDVIFRCSDPATLSQTNDSQIGELTIGTSSAFRMRFYLVNHTGVNFKQRAGVKLLANPSSGATTNEKAGYYGAGNTLDPEMEFNKVYTITLQVGAGGAGAGWWRGWLDGVMVANYVGYNTNAGATNLGAAGNTFLFTSYASTGYTSGPKVEVCLVPRVSITNDALAFSGFAYPNTASNAGTTRVFPCYTPKASEVTGFPFTVTHSGSGTLTATDYAQTAPMPLRKRYVVGSTSVGDTLRISSSQQLGNLESDTSGNQFVAWSSEYIPTGSVVWGIRAGGDTSSYAIAVNYSNGVVREGSTVGSGTILFSLDPAKIYGICLSGNVIDRTARVFAFNLSDEYRRTPLVRAAKLTTQWPTLPLGVQSALYTMGGTTPEPSTMIAGRTFGLMAGDSFGSTYTYNRGSITLAVTGATGTLTGLVTETGTGATGTLVAATVSGGVGNVTMTVPATGTFFQGGGAITFAGGGSATGGAVEFSNTLICTRNNVGQNLSFGAENQLVPNGFRLAKPIDTGIPDVSYMWSIGRSGERLEDMGSTIDSLALIRGCCVFVPGFAYNSMAGITASGVDAALAAWGVEARRFRDTVLSGGNTMIWPSPVIKNQLYTTSAVSAGNYQTVGCDRFFRNAFYELTKNMTSKPGKFYTANIYSESYSCFVGASDNIHIFGDSEGSRYYASRLFGNTACGFTSGALYLANP